MHLEKSKRLRNLGQREYMPTLNGACEMEIEANDEKL